MRIDIDETELASVVVCLLGNPDVQVALRAVLQVQPPAPPVDLFMSAADFSAHVHVSLRTVRLWLASGLPSVGRGRTRRVDVARAMSWLAAGGDQGEAERTARRDASNRAIRRVG
jgi:hypothetical protein